MTYRVSRRRRLAEAVTFALASMSCGALVAAPAQQAKPLSSSTPVSAPLLCGSELLEKNLPHDGLALRPTFGGWELAEVKGDLAEVCRLKATTAGLNLLFEGMGTSSILLASEPRFVLGGTEALPPRRLEVSSTEPVLCESYYPGASAELLSLQVTDPNGRVQILRGVQSFSYRLPVAGDTNSARLTPVSAQGSFGPMLQCYGLPYSTLTASPASDVPAPGIALASTIFDSGFEVQAPPSQRADLRIEILDDSSAYLVRNLQAIIGTPFTYSIRVRNAGPVAASGLRIKEFLADSGVTGGLQPKVDAQGWSCVARGPGVPQSDPGVGCGSGTGVLTVGDAGFSLAGGASRTYTLTRTFPTLIGGQPNAEDGARSVLAAAVFFDPTDATGQGDVSTGENLASAVISLTENPGPSISCSGLANLSLAEAASPRTFNYACTVTDPDGIQSFTASSSDSSKVLATVGTPTGDVYPLTLQIPASVFTTSPVTVTLNATDLLSAAATPVGVSVTVSEVNDPPTVARLYGHLQLMNDGSLPRDSDGNEIVEAGATSPIDRSDCVIGSPNTGQCRMIIADFFAVDAGVGEGSQTVTPLNVACLPENGSPSVSSVFTSAPAVTPVEAATTPAGFGLSFKYLNNLPTNLQIRCTFRFQDNGSPAATSSAVDGEVLFTRFAGS